MKRFLLIVGALLLAAYLCTGIYQVRPGELAVVRRFGRVLEKPGLPGLNLGLPWGLDRVDRIAVDEQRQLQVGFVRVEQPQPDVVPVGQVLTGDNNLIDLRATIYYRVDRETPGAVAHYVLSADRVPEILTRAAETALSATLASQKVDAVLLGQARNLELLLQQHLIATVHSYQLGVVIESVNLTYQPPAELAEVFRQVNRARTLKEIAEREALGAKQIEISAAQQQARRTSSDAQAAARDRVTRAAAEAASFQALWQQYQAAGPNADNALLTLYLKEMQAILARFQVRTLSDQNVDQTVVVPGGDR
jgi:membrane protease subunit HflK